MDRNEFFRILKLAPSGCIEWQGATRGGYGVVRWDGKQRQATHVSWWIKYGAWPELHLLHHCDNPRCVRPSHLFEGTDLDNARDRDGKGRHRTLTRDECSWSKVRSPQLQEIAELTSSPVRIEDVAARYGLSVGRTYQLAQDARGGKRKPSSGWKNAARVEIDGEQITFNELAKRTGIRVATLQARHKRGLTGDDLVARPHRAKRKQYTRRA